MELMCKPSERMLRFIREQMGQPVDEDTMRELGDVADAMVAEQRGTYDFFNERDRWKFLSKELS